MPANLITLVHLSMFSAMNLANSSGEFGGTATAPRSVNRCLMFGASTAALVSLLSIAIISCGVPLAHVQDKIETRCEAGRGFGYSHHQIAAE
jgi:hypothetical protein